MSLRVLSIVFTAAALSAAMVPAPVQEDAGDEAVSAQNPQVVFQLHASAAGTDAGRMISDRLAPAAAWRPRRLKALFAERARADAAAEAPDLERVLVSDVPRGLTAERAAELLAADPRIAYAQPDYLRETHSPPSDHFYQTAGSWGQPYDDMWRSSGSTAASPWSCRAGRG
jgi:hypothetical protein